MTSREPNPEGIAFYRALFEECRKYDIEPLVTLCHFDVPMHLVVEYGSWRNRQMVDFFTRYARTCFEQFDGLVKYWLTFNEINIMLHSPFSGAGLVFEEGEHQEQVKYQAAHHELVASALATQIAHEVNPANQVGCMLAGAALPLLLQAGRCLGCAAKGAGKPAVHRRAGAEAPTRPMRPGCFGKRGSSSSRRRRITRF